MPRRRTVTASLWPGHNSASATNVSPSITLTTRASTGPRNVSPAESGDTHTDATAVTTRTMWKRHERVEGEAARGMIRRIYSYYITGRNSRAIKLDATLIQRNSGWLA
jgi:hypothetical protein